MDGKQAVCPTTILTTAFQTAKEIQTIPYVECSALSGASGSQAVRIRRGDWFLKLVAKVALRTGL